MLKKKGRKFLFSKKVIVLCISVCVQFLGIVGICRKKKFRFFFFKKKGLKRECLFSEDRENFFFLTGIA